MFGLKQRAKINMNKHTRIVITVVVAIGIIIPTLYLRMLFNEWFYTQLVKFIPRVIWLPLDMIFALVWYTILAVCVYSIWEDHAGKNEKK